MTRTFRIIWKDGDSTDVEVDRGAQELYKDESAFDIAAIIACLNEEGRQFTDVEYTREV